jgi:hypothetical protein
MIGRLMTREERLTVRRELRSWQVRRGDVERLLRNAVFGPGATATLADGIEPGVGIMVDESRDPALARRSRVVQSSTTMRSSPSGRPATRRTGERSSVRTRRRHCSHTR